MYFFFIVRGRASTLFFFMWKFSFSTFCWKDYSLSIEWTWHPCHKSIAHRHMGLFWILNSIPLVYIFTLMPVLYCFDYSSFIISFESVSRPVFLFFKDFGGFFFLLFRDTYNFKWIWGSAFSFLQKKAVGILIRVALTLYITVCSIDSVYISVLKPILNDFFFFRNESFIIYLLEKRRLTCSIPWIHTEILMCQN